MKRIILSALAALFLCFGVMGQQVVTKLPNSLPFGLNAEKIYIVSSELLVTKRGSNYGLVWVSYNKLNGSYQLECEGYITKDEARAYVIAYRDRKREKLRRDSAEVSIIGPAIDSLQVID